jgi:hypothetical protein
MNVLESFWQSFWWVLPLLLMVLCCFGMRCGRRFGCCGERKREGEDVSGK